MSNLSTGNRADIGIITLWTKKEQIAKSVSKENYGLIGQLYSRDEGISMIIRSCLLNKNIRYLILCGMDLYNSGEALVALSKNGVDENNKIIGISNTLIHKEIPREAINRFRKNVSILDYRNVDDYAELNKLIPGLKRLSSYGEPESFPNTKPQSIDIWPTDPVGFKIVSKTVGEAWLEILDTVMRFGVKKKTEYGNEMKEVINLMTVVTEEHPYKIKWFDYFNFTKEELEQYIPKLLTDARLKDVEYTYGSRLRSHFGKDQLKQLTEYLKKVPFTRRAVAVTWDVSKDLGSDKAPCLDLLQFLVQENKLYLTVYFRSNDIFDAWPRNAFALRRLQGDVAKDLNIENGSLCIISGSAHIYDSSWSMADKLVAERYKLPFLELDSRGNFVISVDKELIVKHYSPQGKLIEELRGKTAKAIQTKLLMNKSISLVSHALYVGRELEKAQRALEKGEPYVQE